MFYYKKVAMSKNSAYTNELNTLNANITVIISKLKNQNKRADIGSIHKELIKTNSMQDFTIKKIS